jgi:hypothetical protein
MRRVAVLLALAALVLPGASRAVGCSPLTCAPSQFLLAHGTLLATRGAADRPLRVLDLRTGATRRRLPAGIVAGGTLVTQHGSRLTWLSLASGRTLRAAFVRRPGFRLAGASQDGRRAVLMHYARKKTTIAVVGAARLQVASLHGLDWSFDALAGANLYLLRQEEDSGGYQVRRYDLAGGRLDPHPLKDPHESATIWGIAFARTASADGRYVFTLYLGSNGAAMVHELDTREATARCIDLPGTGDFGAAMTYGLVASHDGTTLWAVSPGYGRVVAIDVGTHRVRRAFSFLPGTWTQNAGIATLARDGTRIAISDAQHVWLVDLARGTVTREHAHVALALAFSPDSRRLWGIGERSRVFSLALEHR